ncbi:hypothetical protein NDU88_010945 [Pleurodeles waltl]|uniref:Uncharacterized protein n=1 Tax=Pleurodeles waltl TaxID=8319 RepID=A0AAV7PWQ5_PLEWA|nr:hypothetical protein NDU88_010945 [Pleurodeles waltl]
MQMNWRRWALGCPSERTGRSPAAEPQATPHHIQCPSRATPTYTYLMKPSMGGGDAFRAYGIPKCQVTIGDNNGTTGDAINRAVGYSTDGKTGNSITGTGSLGPQHWHSSAKGSQAVKATAGRSTNTGTPVPQAAAPSSPQQTLAPTLAPEYHGRPLPQGHSWS